MQLSNNYISANSIENGEKLNLSETVRLIGYLFVFIGSFINTTEFSDANPSIASVMRWLIRIGLITIVFGYLIRKNYHFIELVLFIGSVSLGYIGYRVGGYNTVYIAAVLFFGLSGLNSEKMLKITLFLGAFLTVMTILSSIVGIIPNLTYWRGSVLRQSLGFIYPTDFAAHLFYFYLIVCVLAKGIYRWKTAILGIILSYFVNEICDARLDAILLFSATCVFFIYSFNKINLNVVFNKVVHYVSLVIFPILTMTMYALINLYIQGNHKAFQLDTLLSGRIGLGAQALQTYPVRLFGEPVNSNGYGGLLGYNMNGFLTKYFIIDSSYVRILLMNGIIGAIVLLVIIYIVICRAIHFNANWILIGVILIAGHSFVAQFLTSPSYDTIILVGCLLPITHERTVNKLNRINTGALNSHEQENFN